ncbi:Pre-mRNA-processing factor 39 [Chionoecetes opilio]|uniref:Pre-mRNA-processing factor 39 n=1 Tax=Chionoecetes opilio TaxID=41210 RepID=A0A8J5C8H7_CHIOP|nr:Pre-mRNA-processing factor 39 [Chionoecetes opilio]
MWEAYLNWESNGKRWKNVTRLYERLVATPTSRYVQHWQRFQEHVRKHMPSEVVGVEEFLTLRREVLIELNRSDIETPDEAPPGVEAAPGEDQLGTPNVQDEETKLLQKSIIAARQKLHEATATEVKSRWSLEDAIKRPYFHVKPLEKSQLSAWRTYLDYEVKQTIDARIRVLFERCLIACAFYEEFWMRYIRYLEENNGTEEEIRSVYQRACVIHLREKFRPHLSWAAFEEEKGDSDRALEILEALQQGNSPSLEAYMQAAGVERRRGNLGGGRQVFERCLTILMEEPDKNIHSHVSIKFARFLTMFCREQEKALEVLREAHEFNKENSNVVLAMVDQTLLFDPPLIGEAVAALKEGIRTADQPGTQLLFAHRLFHFMSECGQDPGSMSEGLRVLRQVQQEVRQMDTGDAPMAEMDTTDTTTKQEEGMSGGISVIESRRDKRPNQDKTSPGPVNGTTAAANAGTVATGAGQSSMVTNQYQNYQQPGYGQGYGQGYAPGYGAASHYQNWGYPAQQGNYGYGQQGWGNYGNYYGQR